MVFIVNLNYAFQTSSKLFLIPSYCMLFALMFYEKKGDEYKPRVIYNVRNTHTTKEVTVDLELKILYETN